MEGAVWGVMGWRIPSKSAPAPHTSSFSIQFWSRKGLTWPPLLWSKGLTGKGPSYSPRPHTPDSFSARASPAVKAKNEAWGNEKAQTPRNFPSQLATLALPQRFCSPAPQSTLEAWKMPGKHWPAKKCAARPEACLSRKGCLEASRPHHYSVSGLGSWQEKSWAQG